MKLYKITNFLCIKRDNMQINFFFVIIFLLAACAPKIIPAPTTTPKSSTYSTSTAWEDNQTMITTSSTPVSPQLQNLIDKAKGDLTQRLSISENEIILVKARDVVWPDSSLGCPQPGMMYAEVLTPGYLILLEATGQKYEYHAGKSSDIFLCEKPTPPVPGISGET